jgi:hypothetical protein
MVLELSALKLLYCHSGLFINIVNPYSRPNQRIEITSASVERQPRSRVMAGLAREAEAGLGPDAQTSIRVKQRPLSPPP